MGLNKQAILRYHTLDRCFSNFQKRYFIEDLVKECNEAIYELYGNIEGVKKRQIFEDIKFMESEQGWAVNLNRIKDGRRIYYRYAERNFSIKKFNISDNEAEILNNALSVLAKFKGLPSFEWIAELQVRFEGMFISKNTGHSETFVSFESNPYLVGLERFTDLFYAIMYQKVLKLSYKGFKEGEANDMLFHPWHLKQFNNRWFVFGYNEQFAALSTLAIDRIEALEETRLTYKLNTEYNFDEYFDDIVGVSFTPLKSIEKILIKISIETWPYIKSKPLHGSQKLLSVNEDFVLVQIEVQINHELKSLLFSYLDQIEILMPPLLREEIKIIAQSLSEKYNSPVQF